MSLLSDEQAQKIFQSEHCNISKDLAGILYRAIEAAVLKAQKQEPVAWCVAYDDPRMGRIHSNPTMCEPEVDTHVSKCGGVVVKVPLYAAPVVPPDVVSRLQRIAWLIGSIYVHGGFVAETMNERELQRLLEENGTFWNSISEFDKAMIAAAEGKESK